MIGIKMTYNYFEEESKQLVSKIATAIRSEMNDIVALQLKGDEEEKILIKVEYISRLFSTHKGYHDELIKEVPVKIVFIKDLKSFTNEFNKKIDAEIEMNNIAACIARRMKDDSYAPSGLYLESYEEVKNS